MISLAVLLCFGTIRLPISRHITQIDSPFNSAQLIIEVGLGTPPQAITLQLDTSRSNFFVRVGEGSTVGWSRFRPTGSITSSLIPCESTICCGVASGDNVDCSPYCSPFETYACFFQTDYFDSGAIGTWQSDRMNMSGFVVVPQFGGFLTPVGVPPVVGVIGLGDPSGFVSPAHQRVSTFLELLNDQHGVPKIFSICFGRLSGILTLGEADHCYMAENPVFVEAYFNDDAWAVTVTRLNVETISVPISSALEKNTRIDTSASDICFDSATWRSVIQGIQKHCRASGCSQVFELLSQTCVPVESVDFVAFPTISVHFKSKNKHAAIAPLPPTAYITANGCDTGVRLGICNCGEHVNRFGLVFMQPFTWVFDFSRQQIGFAPSGGCDFQPPVCANRTEPTPTPTYDAPFRKPIAIQWPWFVYLLVGLGSIGMGALGALTLFRVKRIPRRVTRSELENALIGNWAGTIK